MTAETFNKLIEEFEINMLEMSADERFYTLMDLTRARHRITRDVYGITELLALLKQFNEHYVNLGLCRAICHHLYVPYNHGD